MKIRSAFQADSKTTSAPAGRDLKPAALGFRMPAEWEEHRATWITWPHHRDDWPGKFAAIPWVYVEIVRYLQRGEKVCIIVKDGVMEGRVRRLLKKGGIDLGQIEFYRFPSDRAWTRDHGPIFVKREKESGAGELALVDWKFNGWAKYPDWRRDDRIPARLARALSLRRFEPVVEKGGERRQVVLEGGSVDTNGQGLLLTTEECLLSTVQARNPGLGREEIEAVLKDYLGIRQVLWLGRGIAGDDTHGHIDDLARFAGPKAVAVASESSESDVNFEPLRENFERLQGMTGLDGGSLEMLPLPMPRPLFFDGVRLPASYLNYYIANHAVLVPTFNDPNDRIALGKLAELFPGREVVGIHSVDLVWGFGTLHCMTQQEPLA